VRFWKRIGWYSHIIPAHQLIRFYLLKEIAMPTPFESAQLNLKLFELRREPLLRQARAWFVGEFHPETLEELLVSLRGEHNTFFRMVVGYWDMAASMVTTGAIDRDAFLAANTEIVATFSKIQPFLDGLREVVGEPGMFRHLETVVMATPDAAARLERTRTRLRDMAKARKERTADQA
jgi:hypothetical protein